MIYFHILVFVPCNYCMHYAQFLCLYVLYTFSFILQDHNGLHALFVWSQVLMVQVRFKNSFVEVSVVFCAQVCMCPRSWQTLVVMFCALESAEHHFRDGAIWTHVYDSFLLLLSVKYVACHGVVRSWFMVKSSVKCKCGCYLFCLLLFS